MHEVTALCELLANPSNEYRSLPFWAWNDALSKDELLFQLNQMQQQGMGGFFIHSREGLETPYLSQSWMDLVSFTMEEAKKLGLETWIYDEDKWPSGSAGGRVAQADTHYVAKVVSIQYKQSFEILELQDLYQDPHILALYSYEPEEQQFSLIGEIPKSTQPLLIARAEASGSSDWYNGSAPTDMMNPEAIAYFLKITHEAYDQALGKFGMNGIAGFFTDEPNVYDFFTTLDGNRPFLPWTDTFEKEFLQRRGYGILSVLPHLFLPSESGRVVRFDYWKTVSELFLDAYTKQVSVWCKNHTTSFTGHFLYENDLGYQIRTSGSIMPHYRYLDIPAIDLLGDQREEYLTVKQCSSVAHQFGKKHVVTETYGCTGWDITFQQQKRLGDWQFVMGVTRRCQHLSLYSITGCRKRDYPPSFNYQSTWWPFLNLLETYFARLSVLTTFGDVLRKILVIHPIGSLWMESGSSIDEDISKIEMNMGWLDERLVETNRNGSYYNDLAKLLLSHQFDFDFADETILSEDASIRDVSLLVGNSEYSLVVVPPMKTLYASTAELLVRFANAGGTIIWMQPVPIYLDARPNSSVQKLIHHERSITVINEGALIDQLRRLLNRPIRIENKNHRHVDGFLTMSRQYESITLHVVLNQSTQSHQNVFLNFQQKGSVSEYAIWDNTWKTHSVISAESDTLTISTQWAPETLRVFIIDCSKEPNVLQQHKKTYHHPHEALHILASMPYRCNVILDSENVLVLDSCSIEADDETDIDTAELWQAQYKLRNQFGFRTIHSNGQPQRYTWLPGRKDIHICTFNFSFIVEQIPSSPVFLAVEKPEHYTVLCNNQKCNLADGYFLDHSIKRFAIPELTIGVNVIEIKVPYQESTEFEEVYLIGSFSVSPDRTIGEPVTHLDIGAWDLQGLKHYSGSVTYEFFCNPIPIQQDEVYIKIRSFRGSLVLVVLNDCEPLVILQEDEGLPVGQYLFSDKPNKITLQVVGSLVNTLGPLHRSARACSRISWEDFRTQGNLYTHWHKTKPMGILDEVIFYTLPPN